ncbi:MAG: hypothetical protein IH830_12625 [Planctomycetes bacterium]|nr:hypothetical protein [Planctomycetota bacterium]
MNSYTGVWRSGSHRHYLWANVSWSRFRSKWRENSRHSLRLVDMNVHLVGNSVRYTGVWEHGTGAHYLWVNASWSSFRAKWRELAQRQLRLTVLKVLTINGRRRYFGVWRPGRDAYYLWVGADWANFRAKWREQSARSMRLVDLEVYPTSRGLRYAGVWRRGMGSHYLWVGASWSSFVSKWRDLAARGLRLTVVKSYLRRGRRRYAGVWRPGRDGYYLWGNTRWQNFVSKWRELNGKNLRLVHLDVLNVRRVPTSPWVRLHIKILTAPTTFPVNTMVESMRRVYRAAGFEVDVASTETLNLPALDDLEIGTCTRGNTTAEQDTLFGNRNNVGANDIPVYFVRTTDRPTNGCAAHADGVPACVVASGATIWTLAHEVGHVLDLNHVNDNTRLMTGNGTFNIISPPLPVLSSSEINTMDNSPLTREL